MLSDIKYGVRDFMNYKILSFVYILFIICCMFTFVSATGSMVDTTMKEQSELYEKLSVFDTVVIGYEPNNPKQLLQTLSSFYEKDGFSFCVKDLTMNPPCEAMTFIIFGDVQQYYPYFDLDEQIGVYAGKELGFTRSVKLNSVEYKIEKRFEDTYNFCISPNEVMDTDNNIFIVIKNPNLVDWVSEDNGSVISELISNTHIRRNDTTKIHEFEQEMDTDFMSVQLQTAQSANEENKEFVKQVIYPFLVFLLINCFLCTSIILDGIILKKTKEFSIHILHGARLKNIFIRLITFYFLIIGMAIMIGVIIGMISFEQLWCYVLLGFLLDIMFSAIVIKKLVNKNLSGNLRNGDNL